MEEKIKIIIASDDTKLVSELVSYINSEKNMKVVDTAKNGLEAIDKILKHKVDVVILAMFMPELDGLGVLERISEKMDILPACIMVSHVINNTIVRMANENGVKVYLAESLKSDVLIGTIRKSIKDNNI